MMRMRAAMTMIVAGIGLSLAACQGDSKGPLTGDGVGALGATVRANPNPAAPWAAYFTLQGGKEAHVLTSVTTDGAERAELHESKMEGGLMTMGRVERLEIPAGENVVLRSGGKHVMLFGVTEAARKAGHLTLTLHFEGGANLPVELAFEPQGDGAAPVAGPAAPATPVADAAQNEHAGH